MRFRQRDILFFVVQAIFQNICAQGTENITCWFMLQYKKDNDISYFSGLSFGANCNRRSTFDMNLEDLIFSTTPLSITHVLYFGLFEIKNADVH